MARADRLTGLPDALRAGDVIAAAPVGRGVYGVRTIPEVSGGMVVESPYDGRVLAVQGGFDAGLGSFNRATQAMRQPGSTIKPFVYATGLDFGMTPASMILDGTFCVYQGSRYGKKCFTNFGGAGGSGNHTMRWGLEQSRNLMTVRIANDAGMDNVVKAIDRVGIGKYDPYLSFALGAGDTTVLQMVNAYSALANHGVQYPATLIDYVQDAQRQGDLAGRHAPLRRLQHGAVGRQADAASCPARQAGDGCAHRLSDGSHARRRGYPRHRSGPARSRPADLRQDRHDLRSDQRLVHRRPAALHVAASISAMTSRARWVAMPRAALLLRRSSSS